ncbi:heme A synthase [Bradyrhizobium sp. GM24.11]|jgi:heme A synthase
MRNGGELRPRRVVGVRRRFVAAGDATGIAVIVIAAGDGVSGPNATLARSTCGKALCKTSQVMEETVPSRIQWFIGVVLAALLVATVWYLMSVWRATPSMPLYGNIIVGVAAILALIAGCGLTALMYYSRRRGYDEPAHAQKLPRD